MAAETGVRVLVCGGRDYPYRAVWKWLDIAAKVEIADRLRLSNFGLSVLIHGGARGADEAAAGWAEGERIKVLAFPANWEAHGKAAGPIRNRKMVMEGKPDVVIAFPGGRGTADMIRTAEEFGIPVIRVEDMPDDR